MTYATTLPAGTATGNADAMRAAPIAQAFQLFADVMQGVDSQPTMEPGMVNDSGLLGPAQTFNLDVGIDANGQPYLRGRSGYGQDTQATPAHDAGAAADGSITLPTIPPLLWMAALAFAAFHFLK